MSRVKFTAISVTYGYVKYIGRTYACVRKNCRPLLNQRSSSIEGLPKPKKLVGHASPTVKAPQKKEENYILKKEDKYLCMAKAGLPSSDTSLHKLVPVCTRTANKRRITLRKVEIRLLLAPRGSCGKRRVRRSNLMTKMSTDDFYVLYVVSSKQRLIELLP